LNDLEFLSKISKELLDEGKTVRFQVKGWSMRPFIQDKDFITVAPARNSRMRIGDIVYYFTPEKKPRVHRVVNIRKKKGRVTYLIKGDATYGSAEHVEATSVLGKVTAVEREGRTRRMDTAFSRIKSLLLAAISPFNRWVYFLGSLVKQTLSLFRN
jgi:signal peptidase I